MIRRAALVALGLFAASCASPPPTAPVSHDRVVLLPHADGSVGAVTVTQAGSEALLESAYAAASAGGDGALQVSEADPAATRAQFAAALQAMPQPPLSFTVFFVFGQDELTEESRRTIRPLLQEVARRSAPDVTVTGHADQVGPDAVNDALSLRRAERVKELLVQQGIPAERITAAGRGAREPLVRGVDRAAEPRNRRVEITVR